MRRLQVRRLTLALAAKPPLEVKVDDYAYEAVRLLDMEQMARSMEITVALASRPRLIVHGVEDFRGACFLASQESDDSSSDEEVDEEIEMEEMDTLEFVQHATAVGFSPCPTRSWEVSQRRRKSLIQ